MKIAEIAVIVDGVVVRTGQGNGGVVSVLVQDWPDGAEFVTRHIRIPGVTRLTDEEDSPKVREKWEREDGRLVMKEPAPEEEPAVRIAPSG